jgi:hypothetical protein
VLAGQSSVAAESTPSATRLHSARAASSGRRRSHEPQRQGRARG